MNAYLTYDRIEDRRWAEQQLTDEKEVDRRPGAANHRHDAERTVRPLPLHGPD